MTITRSDRKLGVAVLNKDRNVSRMPFFTGASGEMFSLKHGLGVIPQDIGISECEDFCTVKTIRKDAFTALVQFDRANTIVTVKFEA